MSQMINLKLEESFLKIIDKIVKEDNYQSRTEFIRQAIREKLEEKKIRQAVMNLRGFSKNKTSDEHFEKVREQAFRELEKNFR